MRKVWVLLTILILGLVAGLYNQAYAEDGILKDFPNLKQGAGYSLADIQGDNELLSLTTVDVVNWKQFSIGAGMITELDNNDNINPAITLNYKVGGLEQWGFTYPLAKIVNIEVGVFASRDFNDEHINYGGQVSFVKIKL